MTVPDISVSLVAYNQRQDLERLLPELIPAAAIGNGEVLLVDYRSSDGTAELVAEAFPAVSVLRNDLTAGYGENHNLNLRRAVGRYFVVMNSDMLIASTTLLAELRDYMDQHPDIGVVAPKILNQDGSIQGLNKRYPSVLDLCLRAVLPRALQPLFRRRLDFYEMRDVGYDREYDVPFLSGAFMFCRTEVLRHLNGFDPRFFMYFEDADLCRRVQESHRTSYYPYASIVHIWERASHKDRTHLKYFIQSATKYFRRWGMKFA